MCAFKCGNGFLHSITLLFNALMLVRICTSHEHLTTLTPITNVVCETVSLYRMGETYIRRHNRWCSTRHHSVYLFRHSISRCYQ